MPTVPSAGALLATPGNLAGLQMWPADRRRQAVSGSDLLSAVCLHFRTRQGGGRDTLGAGDGECGLGVSGDTCVPGRNPLNRTAVSPGLPGVSSRIPDPSALRGRLLPGPSPVQGRGWASTQDPGHPDPSVPPSSDSSVAPGPLWEPRACSPGLPHCAVSLRAMRTRPAPAGFLPGEAVVPAPPPSPERLPESPEFSVWGPCSTALPTD